MKNYVILIGLTAVALILAAVEYFCGCPFEFRSCEFIGGILVLLIGLLWTSRFNRKKARLFFAFVGGMVLICAVNVGINAVYLFKLLLNAFPNMDGGVLVLLTLVMAVYVPFVYIGAIFVYLYYFCDLREVFRQIQRYD